MDENDAAHRRQNETLIADINKHKNIRDAGTMQYYNVHVITW